MKKKRWKYFWNEYEFGSLLHFLMFSAFTIDTIQYKMCLRLCSIYNTFLPTNYTNEWTYHETTIKIVYIKFNGVFLNQDDRHLWNIFWTIATQQELWSIVSWDWSFHLERAHTLMATTTHTTRTHKPIAQIHPNRAQSFQSDNVQASSASQPMRMLQSTRKRNTERECETNVKSSSTREAHLIA